ncbi:V-type ATP synthase subunit I [Breznakiella homolactica]|uniref:V-type ATP synthase subunit I n=1 Tax=Breznakiella homolactica TaxID=2798577 RepID=A0A7T7XKS1_9SPIR|nr:V-type ATPase 116kDa subunit family protein [Breznakiella homolactica]QQO08219.1 V-type ATP synthase subunit I [Breznakiella homolactica]
MIVPMKKVSLVVMDKDREGSLEKLRELGVVHLQNRQASSDRLTKLLEQKAKSDSAIGILRSYSGSKTKNKNGAETPAAEKPAAEYSVEWANETPPADPVSQVLGLADERKNLQEQMVSEIKELSRIEKWGEFNPKSIQELSDQGLSLIPYELPRKTYESLGDDHKVIVLGKDKSLVYCVALDEPIPGEVPLVLPEKSIAEFNISIAEKRDQLADIERQFEKLAPKKAVIEAGLVPLLQDIEFETAKVGMEVTDDTPAEYAVSWISGFVPQDLLGVVKRGAAENGWALIADDPDEEDNPPTLVKNNKFVSLIQPLFNLLGTTPGYREYDISLSYLLFFCLFFAMIFGDAGYGIILLAASVIFGVRSKKKNGTVPDAVLLFGLLSISTIVWGSITGSWFAIPTENLPGFMQAMVIPPFRPDPNLDPKVAENLVQQNIKHMCFIVGTIQIVLAHAKNIKREFPALTFIAQLGWLCMVVGLYFLVLNLVLDRTAFPVPQFALYLIFGGLGAFFIFSEQKGGNFFKNVGKSFANFLPTFLDAVSSFSDIISYIRLFAVGLAGAAIASSFNNMAMGMPEGPVRIIAGGLILIAGHGLNLAMNALSVVVHGVRLNLLEYAGHLGMEWSGHTYSPFAVKDKGEKKD